MTESEKKLDAIIGGMEALINYGSKNKDNETPITCEPFIEELYELRRLMREDLHS